ncbi:MAG: hypothetical protein WC364_13610, partial [Eubacteriales bacterium]
WIGQNRQPLLIGKQKAGMTKPTNVQSSHLFFEMISLNSKQIITLILSSYGQRVNIPPQANLTLQNHISYAERRTY